MTGRGLDLLLSWGGFWEATQSKRLNLKGTCMYSTSSSVHNIEIGGCIEEARSCDRDISSSIECSDGYRVHHFFV